MKIQINSVNKAIIKELDKALQDLYNAKGCIWEDTDARSGINKAEARIETIKSLLEVED